MDLIQNATPALGLLLLLVLLAWGVRKFRQHLVPGGAQATQSLRVLCVLPLSPQQRLVLVEMTDPDSGQRHLITVGVTPHALTALHSAVRDAPVAADAPPATPAAATPVPPAAYAAFQAQLESQLRADRHE